METNEIEVTKPTDFEEQSHSVLIKSVLNTALPYVCERKVATTSNIVAE
jgi:hypothetical protein